MMRSRALLTLSLLTLLAAGNSVFSPINAVVNGGEFPPEVDSQQLAGNQNSTPASQLYTPYIIWDEEADCHQEEEKEKEIDNDQDYRCSSDGKTHGREALFLWCFGPELPDYEDSGNDKEEESIVTDRPDFTEASKSVGKGRIQVEMGYTYIQDRSNGTNFQGHSYPEVLLRLGLFTEWFELRIGQNFGNEQLGTFGDNAHTNGAEDLYLGARFDLTEQKGWLPESSLILQMLVPTGSDGFSDEKVLPGANLIYSWEVIPDCLSMAGSTQANRARDDSGDEYTELAQSFTLGYTLTDKWGAYTEWFALFPAGATAPDVGPEQYFNGGFTYRVTNNLQFDIRAGVGLNDRADDFFTGTGFAFRY